MITRLQRLLARRLHALRHNRRQLEKLALAPHPEAGRLAQVLLQVLNKGLPPELKRVEQHRQELVSQTRSAEILDHGAGSPELGLSREQMESGRLVQEDLAQLARGSSVPPAMARLLYSLGRTFRPTTSLELGSCMGLSACCIGLGLQEGSRDSRLLSIEGDPTLAGIARASLKACRVRCAEIRQGTFQQVLADWLPKAPPVDFLFNDGVHEEHTDWELTTLVLEHMPDNALLLLDDIDWSPGMRRFWKRIKEHERVSLSVDLFRSGLLLTGPPGAGHFRIAID